MSAGKGVVAQAMFKEGACLRGPPPSIKAQALHIGHKPGCWGQRARRWKPKVHSRLVRKESRTAPGLQGSRR